uniref:Uncharacterized protein n=1 Tax=Anopheles coluzzii TaxID=1518534 RepID=A0A8W7PTY0_ANOCL
MSPTLVVISNPYRGRLVSGSALTGSSVTLKLSANRPSANSLIPSSMSRSVTVTVANSSPAPIVSGTLIWYSSRPNFVFEPNRNRLGAFVRRFDRFVSGNVQHKRLTLRQLIVQAGRIVDVDRERYTLVPVARDDGERVRCLLYACYRFGQPHLVPGILAEIAIVNDELVEWQLHDATLGRHDGRIVQHVHQVDHDRVRDSRGFDGQQNETATLMHLVVLPAIDYDRPAASLGQL